MHVFGRGDSGQLGLTPSQSHSTPQHLPLPRAISISAGAAFSLAVTEEEEDNVYGWGYGEMGQLANDSVDAESPVSFKIKGRKILGAEGGGQHTVLLITPK